MTQWTPKLERHIREYADAFDIHMKDVFNAASIADGINVLERDDARLFQLHGKICTDMGLKITPENNAAYMPEMIALAVQNNSNAADKLKRLVSFRGHLLQELKKNPEDDSFEHAIKIAKQISFKY